MPFYPGPGVGGHCIPCDPHYLLWQLRAARIDSPVIRSAMTAIATRPREVVEQARESSADRGKAVPGARVLIVGVAYKPDVADVRESPALEIIDGLVAAGASVSYNDPRRTWRRAAGTCAACRAPAEPVGSGRGPHPAHRDEPSTRWTAIPPYWIRRTAWPTSRNATSYDYDWLAVHPTMLDTTYRSA